MATITTLTERAIESRTLSASMSCDTPAQLEKYYNTVKEAAAKVDASLITITEAIDYVNQRC